MCIYMYIKQISLICATDADMMMMIRVHLFMCDTNYSHINRIKNQIDINYSCASVFV